MNRRDIEDYRDLTIVEISTYNGVAGYAVVRPPSVGPGGELARGLASLEAARAWVDRKITAGLAP